MSLYNPHTPHIIGPEWVPIREVDYQGSRYDSPQEIGFTFSLPSPIRANKAFFHIKEPPSDFVLFQPYTIGIYPAGTEADTGPIQRLRVNVSDSSTFTNSGSVGVNNGMRLINGGTVAACLVDPSNDAFISVVTGNDASWDLRVRFNMAPYAAILADKRILSVNVLWAMNWFPGTLTGNQTYGNYRWYLANNDVLGGSLNRVVYPINQLDQWVPYTVNRTPIGDTNMNYNVTTYLDVQNIAPWTGSELQRFASTGTDTIVLQMKEFIHYALGEGQVENIQLTYMALEIIYCEEQRVAFGTHLVGPLFSNHYVIPPPTIGRNVHDLWWLYNANTVILRDPNTTGSTNPILPAGDYTMTVMQSNVGTTTIASPFIIPPPTLQTARQLYEIPSLQGIQIDHPIPVDDKVVGKTFTKTVTDILPQLSLWTSGTGVGSLVSNVHAYGRQTQGQVFGTVTCNTGINNPGGMAYNYARFYARRFGTTTSPLALITPALSGGVPLTWALIGVPEFDALPEIVDGWKEVTLEFIVPIRPTFGNSTFTWIASNENAGSRWEVLGASALALSGVPSLWYTQYPTQVPYGDTYGGTTSFETWMPGYVIPDDAEQADASSDGILMLAQALPAVSGFSITQLTQPLSGIGLNCNGLAPPGVPTSITYNQLSWVQSNNINFDDFQRTPVASGWGGQWTISAGASSIYSTSGTYAQWLASNSLNDFIRTGTTMAEVDITGEFSIETSNDQVAPGVFYHTDANNYYGAFILFEEGEDPDFDNGTGELGITVRVGGVATNVSILVMHLRLHDRFKIRFQVQGGMLRAKAWHSEDPEPDEWQISQGDTRLTTGRPAVGSIAVGTAPSVVFMYDFLAVPFPLVGSTYQIERMDTVDTDWQVIMKATDLSLHSFKDYEARVGILTSYRMRMVDAYNFNGVYTSTVTSTIAAPGIAGTTVGTGSHIMIFTSNERQDGSINLAYSNAWTDDVTENFSFPEAGFNQLQAMYNKDFYTVFRPLERGGEQFTRNLLVNAAAISPPTLGDFRSLRNMAWDQVPYICVRDEGGNRWFANVQVPSGAVSHLRQLYLAAISITEVTDIPSQVDP